MSGTNTCGGLTAGNTQLGVPTDNVEIPNGNAPKQDLINSIDTAVSTLGPGWKARITPQGGLNDRASGTENHPNGDAADIQLFYNGELKTPVSNPNEYSRVARAFTAYNNDRGLTVGLGGYDSFMHMDLSGWRQVGDNPTAMPWGQSGSRDSVPGWLSSGINQGKADAAGGLVPTPSPKLPKDGTSGSVPELDTTKQVSETEKTKNVNCASPSGGGSGSGCSPISVGAVGVAASLAAGLGFQIPPVFQTAVNVFKAATSGNVAEALVSSVDLISSNNPARDILTSVNKEVATAAKYIGHNTAASGLLGTFSPAVNAGLGSIVPALGHGIDTVSKKILGNVPTFVGAFQLASAASGSSVGLGKALNQSVNRLFGSTAAKLASTGTYLLGGYHNMDIREMGGYYRKPLIGPLNDTLPVLNNDSPMAPFSSLYNDYNGMVTQGFGSLTTDLDSLGRDLSELGYLADLKDLFRIGTAGQICSQLVMLGVGYDSGVIRELGKSGLSVKDVNTFEADDIAYDILASITDAAEIDAALIGLEISNRTNIANLADLCDPAKLFPRSNGKNNFIDLNEIAPFLAMCGIGDITTLTELGRLFYSMETVYDLTDVNQELQPVRLNEIDLLQGQLAPVSDYSGDNDLTVADFIGTAVGYGHENRLSTMKNLQEDLWSDSITNDLQDLLILLQDVIDGGYTGGGFITVPTTGGYTFGAYATLDDAVSDVSNAVNEELNYISDTATGDIKQKLFDLQNYHNESVGQLYKESFLRQQYGINIGNDTRGVDQFYGDGSTLVFTLSTPPQASATTDVYVNGVKQDSTTYTIDTTAGTVTFTTAPAISALIEITYDNGQIKIAPTKSDSWSFAQSLESYGKSTGFGRESDFLSKAVTNDFHGQRIKAVMIQGRNKDRAESFGIACTGDNRALSELSNSRPNGIQAFAERTGVWPTDPGRAADVYLQINDPDSTSRDIYYQRRLSMMASLQDENRDRMLREILDSLLFVADDQMILTDLGATAYDNVDPLSGIYNQDLLNTAAKKQGYVLGPSTELITALLDQEKLFEYQSEYYSNPSKATLDYLDKIGITIPRLVSIMQMSMLGELSNTYGLNLADTRSIFGVPSVSKILLQNLSQVN